MFIVNASVWINRSPADVFAVVSDPRHESRWIPGARDIELLTLGDVARGSRFRGRYDRAGIVELELVEYEPPHRLTLRAHSSIVDFDDIVRLGDLNGGTRLEATMVARPKGIMRLFAFAMRGVMKKQFAANWRHLKSLLETTG